MSPQVGSMQSLHICSIFGARTALVETKTRESTGRGFPQEESVLTRLCSCPQGPAQPQAAPGHPGKTLGPAVSRGVGVSGSETSSSSLSRSPSRGHWAKLVCACFDSLSHLNPFSAPQETTFSCPLRSS